MRIPNLFQASTTALLTVIFTFCLSIADQKDEVTTMDRFTFASLNRGEPISLSEFSGKVVMIVNTASECGLTFQYKGLEQLYQTYKDSGFVIIGVPSNDFGGQEPGMDTEIAEFCQLNFGISFPMTTKYNVRGKNAHPFYQLAQQILGKEASPKWNFHKYLIGRDQHLLTHFNSTTAPNDKHLIKALQNALAVNVD